MFVSIVTTALIMHYAFSAAGIVPESARRVEDVARFAFDYTFYLNGFFVLVAGALIWLHRRHRRESSEGMDHAMNGGVG